MASTVYGPAEENEHDATQQWTRRVVRYVSINTVVCGLTQSLSKGQYVVFCVDQRWRHIDFAVPTILSRPSVPSIYHPISRSMLYVLGWQPRHLPPQHLNPYPDCIWVT